MKVLIITGDQNFGPGNPRFELQKSGVETLAVMYWGRGSIFPRLPAGQFDVVTVQDPFWRGLFAWHVARKLGAKFNVQVHIDMGAMQVLRRILARFVLHHADSVRVVSEKIRQQVKEFDIRVKIAILPIYIDAGKFRAVAHVSHVRKTILWIGRFEDEKDPLLAIKVFKQMRTLIDARLVMLGKGSLEGVMQVEAQGLPIEFPGWQDPVAFLGTADVVLCTSRAESWGASIIEALAAGVPVIAPDVGVAREAGAIVVPRTQLAEALVSALRNHTQGRLMLPLLDKEVWTVRWRESLL